MNWVKGSDLSAIVKKFKSEPQNTRLPCEMLCTETVAVTLVSTAHLSQICLRA
jgi:hypothetical protein